MPPDLPDPFALLPRPARGRAAILGPAARCAERLLGLSTLGRLYRGLPGGRTEADFCDVALAALDVRWEILRGDIDGIPRTGPLVVVANHPYGGLDGLVLGSLLQRVRRDVRFLGNHLIARIPEIRALTIPLDPFPGGVGGARNVLGLRAAIRWVRDGGALIAFPAGEVAHFELRRLRVQEPPWLAGIGLVVRASESTVVPAKMDGSNSLLFHAAGCLHARLRTALLPRELLGRRHAIVGVRLGSPIPFGRLRRFVGPAETAAHLQARCELLGAGEPSRAGRPRRKAAVAGAARRAATGAPVADPHPPERLAEEVNCLSPESTLVEGANLRVLVARAEEIPALLGEIGRLRELTFRQVGEGTGAPADLDGFDAHYLHLFAWNAERRQVVGAYRMGPTDEILPARGAAGLYTSTLFRYDEGLLRKLDPALELGRAFVRPEYQRDYSPLSLLWKGIARFVVDRPRYRRLFGPVSISNDYDSVSKRILVAFLELHRRLPDLARLVRPRRPPKHAALEGWEPHLLRALTSDEDEVNTIVAELERHQRAMPVLLRQYLKLNARLLAFNVDPAFGNALDGLMLVDLADVEAAILARYMGVQGARAFRAHHDPAESAAS